MRDLDAVLATHERTKHAPFRPARGPGGLDWANQPDPWRRYAGVEVVPLPLGEEDGGPPFLRLHEPRPAAPPTLEAVGRLLTWSLAISAWKEYRGHRWALRCNPSSGNLHPTEGWVLLPALPETGGEPGLFHYRALDHALERRWRPSAEARAALRGGAGADPLAVALSTVPWREAWKYGERAFRYCQLDLGHALAALDVAAALLGWRPLPARAAGSGDVAGLLGLDRAADFAGVEPEEPGALVRLVPAAEGDPGDAGDWPSAEAVRLVRAGRFEGRPSRLSRERVEWPVIDEVARATRRPRGAAPEGAPPAAALPDPVPFADGDGPPAVRIVRRRRSALALDGATALPLDRFLALLDRTLPRPGHPPFRALLLPPAVHLVLFVHRVDGLEPGLYCLPRRAGAEALLARAMRREFAWAPVAGVPAHLPLRRLRSGDLRGPSRLFACDQELGSDGAFAVAMLAEFAPVLRRFGAWAWRDLHHEAGAVGHALYLGAEAAGMRATGIGCFFDDEVHRFLGIADRGLQVLYHLAVGAPVDDPRLTTHPAYPAP